MATDFGSAKKAGLYNKGVIAEEITLRPVVLAAIGAVRGKTVLDLGCGDGRYSELLERRGARVIAVDRSSHQITLAQRHHARKRVQYAELDATRLPRKWRGVSDAVLMNMVVPDLDSLTALRAALRQASRALKPRGRLVLSTLHPLYLAAQQDDFDKPDAFSFKNYFKEGSNYRATARLNGGGRISFRETHFSLEFVSRALHDAGFVIERALESKQDGKRGMLVPKYIVLCCRKCKP